MLTLQRRVGNRAARTVLLQRQEADEPAGPLNATQVAAAIRFYAGQPTRYTPEIIREIQARVGVEQTGAADAATVQAVATFQQNDGTEHPELKIDGMAGPRTLPRMFPTGLKAPGEAQTFGEEAQTEVIDRWHDLTPQQRAAELVRLVNLHLEAVGVPAVTPNPIDTGTNLGTFDFTTWAMDIGVEALAIAQPDRAQAADVVDTIYHEARHAEQWFRIAQLRALQSRRGEGAAEDERLGRAIAAELQIPRRIADRAVTSPPRFALGSMEALVAQGWFDSIYGTGRDRRNAGLDRAGPSRRRARAGGGAVREQPDAAEPGSARASAGSPHSGTRRARPAPRGERCLPDRCEHGCRRHAGRSAAAAAAGQGRGPERRARPVTARRARGGAGAADRGSHQSLMATPEPPTSPRSRTWSAVSQRRSRDPTPPPSTWPVPPGGDVADDGAPLGVKARGDVPGVEQVNVTRQWDSEVPNAAAIALSPGLTVAQLEARLGEARSIPSVRPGEQLVVLGGDESDATTLAAVDASGGVRGITVRRETA